MNNFNLLKYGNASDLDFRNKDQLMDFKLNLYEFNKF